MTEKEPTVSVLIDARGRIAGQTHEPTCYVPRTFTKLKEGSRYVEMPVSQVPAGTPQHKNCHS